MHAIGILQRCLSPLLKHIHVRRLATLLEAVASCVDGPALSLTDLGRRFGGEALLRHPTQRRVDRACLLLQTPIAQQPVRAFDLVAEQHLACEAAIHVGQRLCRAVDAGGYSLQQRREASRVHVFRQGAQAAL